MIVGLLRLLGIFALMWGETVAIHLALGPVPDDERRPRS